MIVRYLAALALFAGPALAQVSDDSDWSTSNGKVVNFDVSPDSGSHTGWSVTAIDESGFSNPVPCRVDAQGNAIGAGLIHTPGSTYDIVSTRVGARPGLLCGTAQKLRFLKEVRKQRGCPGVTRVPAAGKLAPPAVTVP